MAGLQWFRLYAEFATDPKVQTMSEAMQRRLIMLFCLQCCDALVTLCDAELAVTLRISEEELDETRRHFIKRGFLTKDGKISNWNKRQFKSDSSRDRTRRYRDRLVTSQQSHGDVSVTHSESESESEYRVREKIRNPSARRNAPTKNGEWFDHFKTLYPRRAGAPGWTRALRTANARLREGHQPAEFIAGAERYARYCEATGKIGTEFVQQAATFLGPEKGFLQNWDLPATKAENRLAANLSAAEEFMRRTDPDNDTWSKK